MKQIIQNYRTGKLELAEVPIPICPSGKILVKNIASLISLGTERSIIGLGKKSLLGKAKARPDLVKKFMGKVKKEGFVKSFQEALGRLDNPTPLGYSAAGMVIEVGNNVHKFSSGDRVACIGPGYASHAEYITVPENLCCKIPDNLTFEEASFGMLGIIALHGVRCTKITFGESVAVIGLGLLGLLTLQILKAYGNKVIGMDIDSKKVKMAKKLGADYTFTSEEDLKSGVEKATGNYGADAIIITASTKSDVPVNTAIDVAKYGGRIVMVGVADIHPHRNEMWHKEVEIIVSKAGGPGTFDPFYENKGIDYPIGYVRWTENRNLVEFLRLIAKGNVNVTPLISHKFNIEQAESVYKDMLDNRGGPYIGVILKYPENLLNANNSNSSDRTLYLNPNQGIRNKRQKASPAVGVIGAGLFGRVLLLPALKKIPNINLDSVATSSSANAYHTAKKYGFQKCTTNYKEIIIHGDIDSVIILTPHSLHAKMIEEALNAGKHVFVEKPLCINEEELSRIIGTYNKVNIANSLKLIVGYNRRFSPHSTKVAEYLMNRQDPMVINYRVNAGFVPANHWVHSEEEGGSRVIGEMCHFVDMLQFLTKSDPVRVFAERISSSNKTSLNSDNCIITLKFGDGSIGNIIYSASGDKAFSREKIEIFCEGKSIVINDYRQTVFHNGGKKKTFKTCNQQMGYKEELQHFFDSIRGKTTPLLTPGESFLSTRAVFSINAALKKGTPIEIKI